MFKTTGIVWSGLPYVTSLLVYIRKEFQNTQRVKVRHRFQAQNLLVKLLYIKAIYLTVIYQLRRLRSVQKQNFYGVTVHGAEWLRPI